jgi:tRNA threonylcarbamoyladenosine biosynthesis protein TsaB
MLLAIDTATQVMSIALHDGRSVLAEHTWQTANNHTIELAPAVHKMLEQCDVGVPRLTGLAVSIGPGSYSGLRVGVALAKGLALARKLPLVGVSSLDTIAAGQPHYQGGLIVVVQAGRGRITVGRYQWRKGRWSPRGEPQLMEWETLIASIDGTASVTGEVDEQGHLALAEAIDNGAPVTLAAAAFRLRRAGFLAEEAWERLKTGKDHFDAGSVAPIYIKTKDSPS